VIGDAVSGPALRLQELRTFAIEIGLLNMITEGFGEFKDFQT
jgi:hypothetical protein